MSIVVAICTYRRPDGLRRLLDGLCELELADGSRPALDIVVVDSDAAGQEGLRACKALPANYPFPVHTAVASEPGISPARNAACLKALSVTALSQRQDERPAIPREERQSLPEQPEDALIAFLDDDEWPSRTWLAELLRVQQSTGADAVGGPTRSVFPEGSDPALARIPYYGADMYLPDGAACTLQAGGNFLIRARTLARLGPGFFHSDFAESGSEDLAFFMQLAALGARMHWAAHAVVHEHVPRERLAPDWLRHRVINVANGRVRAAQMLEPSLGASLLRGTKTAGLLVAAEVVALVGLVHAPLSMKGKLMRWRGRGKLMAHLGMQTVRRESA